MKVFLVSLILLVLTAALFFMVSSQNTIAPIVYLTRPLHDERYPPDFNFQVMDVNTGDIIFESATEEADCPYDISPNGRWLRYGLGINPSNMDFYLLNIATAQAVSANVGQLGQIYWFSDSLAWLYFEHEDYGEPYIIYQYNISTELESIVAERESQPRFYQVEDSFVYINEFEPSLVEIYQLDGTLLEIELPYSRFSIVNFSPDGRFILFTAMSDEYDNSQLYLFDTSTSHIEHLEDAVSIARGTWNPETNQLIYHIETHSDNTITKQIVLYDPIKRERQSLVRYSYWIEHIKYYWSSDTKYLVLAVSDANSDNIILLNLESNELLQADGWTDDFGYGSGMLRWTSSTEFAYIMTDFGGSIVQGEEYSDVFLYNVETHESRNLTNTPDILEFTGCWWG